MIATWTTSSNGGSGTKTITGCTVGQPVLFIHAATKDSTNAAEFAALRVENGSYHNSTKGDYYIIGTHWGDVDPQSTNVFVVIPNATSITIHLFTTLDDEKICVFKQ